MTAGLQLANDRCDCGGKLTAHDGEDEFVVVCCEHCGEIGGVHRSRVSPPHRRERLIELAGFPAGFVGAPIEPADETKSVLYRLRAWIDDYGEWRRSELPKPAAKRVRPPASPALWGKQGRGKTLLLVATCVRLIDEMDVPVMFRSARQLLRELQQFEREKGTPESPGERTWRRVVDVDVLALDDVGAQQITDWRHDQLADLIDERYQRQLPTLIATNFPPASWEGQIVDTRTYSRLRQVTFAIELRGPDRRQLAITPTERTEHGSST